MDDVHKIAVSTPFNVGRVNCYAFGGEELTLLDPGPSMETAYEDLSAGLDEQGLAVSDVDRILVTHPHIDHFGLASRIVEESGARVLAHVEATRNLSDPVGYYEQERAYFEEFFPAMGVPAETINTAVTLPEAYLDYQEPLAVDRELTDGDTTDVGVELQVVHTPGHAPGSVCFVAREEGVVFTGDHVLEHISPNPLLTLAPGTDDERTRSLPTYFDSLERIRGVDADVAYPGHGDSVSDLDGRVQEILDHHEQRKETIAGMIAEMGPTTAFDIMQEMFPDLPATEVFPGMSEVIGHLDLLEDEDAVDITVEGGMQRYRQA